MALSLLRHQVALATAILSGTLSLLWHQVALATAILSGTLSLLWHQVAHAIAILIGTLSTVASSGTCHCYPEWQNFPVYSSPYILFNGTFHSVIRLTDGCYTSNYFYFLLLTFFIESNTNYFKYTLPTDVCAVLKCKVMS